MRTLRLAGVTAGLLLAVACQSTSTAKSTPSHSPSSTATPAESTKTAPWNPVLVGLDRHDGSPSTVTVVRPNGSVVANRTLPADRLVGQHAVGAYMLVSTDGSHKAWTVDASGEVREVA